VKKHGPDHSDSWPFFHLCESKKKRRKREGVTTKEEVTPDPGGEGKEFQDAQGENLQLQRRAMDNRSL